MILRLIVALALAVSLHGMEVDKECKAEWAQLQLQDVRICISPELFRTLEGTIKPVKMADGQCFLAITVHEWKLLEPYFTLVMQYPVKLGFMGQCEKKMQRLCNMLCGRDLAELKGVAQKIKYELLLNQIDCAEKSLNMLQEVYINDNDRLTLLTSDWKKVKVSWRLAKVSRILELLMRGCAEGSFQVPLQRIDLKTWRTIRQLLTLMHRVEKKKGGISAERARKKIDFVIAGLDEALLIRLLSAVNYMEIPQLYEKTKSVLRCKKIANYQDEALLELPANERNLVIRSALFELLGPLVGDVIETYPHTVNATHALCVEAVEGDRLLAVFAGKGELLMINLKNGKCLKYPLHEFESAFLVHVSKYGYIISAHSDSTFKIWNHKSPLPVRVCSEETFGNYGLQVNGMCLGANGRLYTCHLDGAVRVWHEETGKEVRKLYGGDFYSRSNILSVCLVNDGSEDAIIAAGSVSGYLLLWALNSGNFLSQCEDELSYAEPVYALCAGEDGRVFAGSCDGTVRVWDSANGALLARFKVPSRISSLCSSLENVLICGLADGTIHLIDSYSGIPLMICKGHKSWVYTLAIEKAERLFSGAPSPDGFIRSWDVRILSALKNMTLLEAQEVVRYLQEQDRAAGGGRDCVELSWQGIKKILGLKDLQENASVATSCLIQ